MRRRRSIHFVPGGNDKMLNKALGLPADALILDLEDSVTPQHKEAVRVHRGDGALHPRRKRTQKSTTKRYDATERRAQSQRSQ